MSGVSLVTFQFWDDRQYQSYPADVQHFLNAQLYAQPRPKDVNLPGGKYVIRDFDTLEKSGALQENLQTGYQRHLRLQPPYVLPGGEQSKVSAADAAGISFQYLDGSWQDYAATQIQELQLTLQCAPVPPQILLAIQGKAYWVCGIECLARGDTNALFQLNVKTGFQRKIRVIKTGAAVPSASSSAAPAASVSTHPAPTATPAAAPAGSYSAFRSAPSVGAGSAASRGRPGAPYAGSGSAGAYGGPPPSRSAPAALPATSSSRRHPAPAPAPTPPPRRCRGSGHGCHAALLSSAEFRISQRPCATGGGRGPGNFERIASEAQAVLLRALLKFPREDQVTLPSGDVIENFSKLELDGAGCKSVGGWLPMELQLPSPPPGTVMLPAELDEDDEEQQAALTKYGRYLKDEELASLLPSTGDRECAICRCEFVGASNAASSSAGGDGCGGGNDATEERAFELRCGHIYHEGCLKEWFKQKRRCPSCQMDFGKIVGSQPRVATMTWRSESFQLPGHPKARETFVIEFDFPPGKDDSGKYYEGRRPKCYLPCDCQGILQLELFKVAFKRRVMFGLGTSMSFGTYRPTFNIHIKTSSRKGGIEHGYPDDDYYMRSLDELRANGVTLADIAPTLS